MIVTRKIDETRKVLAEVRSRGESIGFVPTMGYLHEGHLSLVDIAKKHSSYVVMSIFVNPLQFAEGEDYEVYPRDEARDTELASSRGVDLLFIPDVDEMYPEESLSFVEVERITEGLCGRSRPGHFRGVTTVVAKLLNIVGPDVAVFGQKDAQQAIAIRKMVRDLNFPCEVIVGPTVREEDGLAMSSRNSYLSPEERKQAAYLYRALEEARKALDEGERRSDRIKARMMKVLEKAPLLRIDYISITDTSVLDELETVEGEVLIALAAYLGRTRLIDNIIVET